MINSDIAAVIVEPIQRCSWRLRSIREFLKSIRDACNDHSVLMIVDEVQSGMGRSGKYFCTKF